MLHYIVTIECIRPILHYIKPVLHHVRFMLCCVSGSSVVRAFAHGAMGRRIDPSWGGPIDYFSFQPVIHDWCNKGCDIILSVG